MSKVRDREGQHQVFSDGTFSGSVSLGVELSSEDEKRIRKDAEKEMTPATLAELVARYAENRKRLGAISASIENVPTPDRHRIIEIVVNRKREELIESRKREKLIEWNNREADTRKRLTMILHDYNVDPEEILPALSIALSHYRSFTMWGKAQPEPKQIAADLEGIAKAAERLREALKDLSAHGEATLAASARNFSQQNCEVNVPQGHDLDRLALCARYAAAPLLAGKPNKRKQYAKAEAFKIVIDRIEQSNSNLSDVKCRELAALLMTACLPDNEKMPEDDKNLRALMKLSN